jgi:putative tricarboxylic transport membrane protein
MKSNDVPIGAGLLVLSLLILWHVSTFPPAPGQPYNAALFPGIAAAGLAIASIMLIVSGLRKRSDEKAVSDPARDAELEELAATQDVEVLETAKVPSRKLAMILTAGAIVFYLLAANFLGFIITGTIILAALMWSYGVAFKVLVPVAILAALLIHTAFYKLLSVPLPWGVLQPLAW